MAEELLRSKHAFGSESGIAQAIADGKIDAFDILFLDGDTDHPKMGWLDKNGNVVLLKDEKADLTEVEADIDNLETNLSDLGLVVDKKADADKVENSYAKIKYEISNVPVGTLVDYRDHEIRVMCKADTVFTKQDVGSTGNANMYYMAFKAYAPDGAVSFKEGDHGVIVDEMFTFDTDFAGTDEYGRNYSICWLALASYDEASGTWTYFGKNSTESKYIGWDYVVEWYNTDGIVIASDSIRINLSNEECHFTSRPFYLGSLPTMEEVDTKIEEVSAESVKTAKAYTDEQIAALESSYTVIEF